MLRETCGTYATASCARDADIERLVSSSREVDRKTTRCAAIKCRRCRLRSDDTANALPWLECEGG